MLAYEKLDGYYNFSDTGKPYISARLSAVDWLPVIDNWPELDLTHRTLVALQEGWAGKDALSRFEEWLRKNKSQKRREFLEGSRSMWWHRITEVQIYGRGNG